MVGQMTADYAKFILMGSTSDVGGGGPGGDIKITKRPTLANISLGWMVKEAIEANVGLIFRPDVFRGPYLGVLAAIGPENYLRAKLKVPQPADDEIPQALPLNLPNRYIYNSWKGWELNGVGEIEKREGSVGTAERMERVFLHDARANTGDKLEASRWWWVLEWIPLWEIRVDLEGHTKGAWRYMFSRLLLA